MVWVIKKIAFSFLFLPNSITLTNPFHPVQIQWDHPGAVNVWVHSPWGLDHLGASTPGLWTSGHIRLGWGVLRCFAIGDNKWTLNDRQWWSFCDPAFFCLVKEMILRLNGPIYVNLPCVLMVHSRSQACYLWGKGDCGESKEKESSWDTLALLENVSQVWKVGSEARSTLSSS